MNIPQGYKQTELGIIPEDWEVVNLGNIAKVNGRIGFRGYTVADLVPKGFGAITLSPSNIINNQIDYSNCTYISWYKYHESPEIKVRNGDILLVKTGSTFGKSAFVKDLPEKATINPQFVLLNNFKCDSRYLSYVIAHDIIQNQIHADIVGGAIPTLSQEKIANFTLFAPKDIAEQRAIAEALSDVDGLIAALDKKIAKKRLLKQGVMQQLLTGKTRLPSFTNKWVEKPIRLLCKLYGRIGFRGYTKADLVNKGEGAITFSPSDIHEQVISYTNCDYISWRKYDESPEIQVFNGDIIFCKTASIGKCAIIKNLSEKATINPQFVVLKDFKCNNEWLYYSIIDRKFQTVVSGITGGSTIPTMSQEKLYEQTLLCPPTIEEQQAIATILSDMDKEIADLEAQRDKYRLLKSGMMQKLLTGQVRLKTE